MYNNILTRECSLIFCYVNIQTQTELTVTDSCYSNQLVLQHTCNKHHLKDCQSHHL